jgi:hypothetical protein
MLVLRLISATAAIGVLAFGGLDGTRGVAGAAQGRTVPVPGPGPVVTGQRCAPGDGGAAKDRPERSARPGASSSLVPAGAVEVLLCRYSGLTEPAPLNSPPPEFTLSAERLIASGATVSRLASELDAIAPTPPGAAYSCPAGFGAFVVARFRYPAGADDPVTVDLSDCNDVTNGLVHRLALGAPVIRQLATLVPAPKPATLRGHVQLCGGAAPGGCHVSSFTSCGRDAASCVTTDRVAIYAAGGRRVAVAALRRARFSLKLLPGRYTVKLLGDGPRVRGRVIELARVRAPAGRTTTIVFGISEP